MPRRAPDPATLIEATLKRNPYASFADKARQVVAELAAHDLVIRHQPAGKTIRRDCPDHPGTETPGGICPHGCGLQGGRDDPQPSDLATHDARPPGGTP